MAFWNVDVSRFALSALSFHPFIALEGCLEEGCCFVILARKDGKILRGDNFTREGIKLIFFFFHEINRIVPWLFSIFLSLFPVINSRRISENIRARNPILRHPMRLFYELTYVFVVIDRQYADIFTGSHILPK